jgi:GNAT superfamily N-acetyltransferase
MHLKRDDGYELSDDKARLDVDRVSEWLSTDAYWALGRPRGKTEASIAASDAYGIYAPDGSQAAFARMVTDRETFAWLCDVYVARPHRGVGLGKWLVAALRDEYQVMGIRRILLATNDAHGVYATAGFTPLAAPERWMELSFERPDPASA